MSSMTWDELAEQAWHLEEAGQFAAALALITPHKALFPSQWFYYHAQLRCAAQLGTEQTLAVLRTALEDGYWFDEESLHREPALAPILATPAVDALLALSRERRTQAQAAAAPMLLTIQPPRVSPPYPALLALHGAGSSIAASMAHWQPLVQQGWLVALPQSSQVGDGNGYIWHDQDRAVNEIMAHATALRAGYPVDARQFVVSGFSMGGGLAIHLAVSKKLNVCGFFAVAPYVPDLDSLMEQAQANQPQGLRGYMVVGEEDEGCFAIAQKLGAQLPASGIPCKVEVRPQVGHWFPPDFAQSVARGLAFLTQGASAGEGVR